MTCLQFQFGIICLANIAFLCPYCMNEFDDSDDKYLNRVNSNKSAYTKIKCSCGERFGMTYNYMGDAVSFKLKTK